MRNSRLKGPSLEPTTNFPDTTDTYSLVFMCEHFLGYILILYVNSIVKSVCHKQ